MMVEKETDPFSLKLCHLKQTDPVCVQESAPYGEVLETLRRHKSGFIVICRGEKVSGVFTTRDFLEKCVLKDVDPATRISEFMSRDPVTVCPEATVGEAIAWMRKKDVPCLPMVDAEGRIKGLVNVGVLLRFLAYMFPAEVVNMPPRPKQTGERAEGA